MTTPLRQQYLRIKKQFPDVIVMFRLGDLYESFDDAKKVAEACNIVLTARDMGTGSRMRLVRTIVSDCAGKTQPPCQCC